MLLFIVKRKFLLFTVLNSTLFGVYIIKLFKIINSGKFLTKMGYLLEKNYKNLKIQFLPFLTFF